MSLNVIEINDEIKNGLKKAADQMWPARDRNMDTFRVEDGLIKMACYKMSLSSRMYYGDVSCDPTGFEGTDSGSVSDAELAFKQFIDETFGDFATDGAAFASALQAAVTAITVTSEGQVSREAAVDVAVIVLHAGLSALKEYTRKR